MANLAVLLAPRLLAAAHAMTLIALVSFGARAGGAPLHPVRLIAYAAATAATLAATGWLVRSPRSQQPQPGATPLLALSTPALASFIFWVGLGGPYAPYDAHDGDLVRLSYLTSAILYTVIAVLYGALSYLWVTCVVQIGLYLGTYALPGYLRYPPSGLIGSDPSIFAALCGVYLTGAFLAHLRNRIVGRRAPGLWAASMLISLISALFLYAVLTWLPQNGVYVGYIRTGSYVPEDAWDWTRSAAESLVIAAAPHNDGRMYLRVDARPLGISDAHITPLWLTNFAENLGEAEWGAGAMVASAALAIALAIYTAASYRTREWMPMTLYGAGVALISFLLASTLWFGHLLRLRLMD